MKFICIEDHWVLGFEMTRNRDYWIKVGTSFISKENVQCDVGCFAFSYNQLSKTAISNSIVYDSEKYYIRYDELREQKIDQVLER